MDSRLSLGMYSLAYLGVNPVTPPQLVRNTRRPTTTDLGDPATGYYVLGTYWLKQNNVAGAVDQEVWQLVRVVGNAARWIMVAGGSGNVIGLRADDGNTALPTLGIINVLGGVSTDTEAANALVFRKNIHTAADNPSTDDFYVKLNDSISFPNTTVDGKQGVIYFGGVAAGNRFLHNYGSGNIFLGTSAGHLNVALTGSGNIGIGQSALSSLTTGQVNTAIGFGSGIGITTGDRNVLVGVSSGITTGSNNTLLGVATSGITTGSNNTIAGNNSGTAYSGAESNNTILGANIAGTAAESNVIRIGNASNTAAYFTGISGVAVSNRLPVVINSVTNQLGTVATGLAETITVNSGTVVPPFNGNWNVFGAAAPAVNPGNAAIYTTGNSGTGTVTITLSDQFTRTFNTGSGTATGSGSAITIAGGTGISTTGAGSTVTVSAAATVATQYTTDTGTSPVILTGNTLAVLGGTSGNPDATALTYRKNIRTVGAANEIDVTLNNSLSFPATTADGLNGVIFQDGVSTAGNQFLHSYGNQNVWLGRGAGNFTTPGGFNTGVGYQSLMSLGNASQNTCIGWKAGTNLTVGGANTFVGAGCFTFATTNGNNVGVGSGVAINGLGTLGLTTGRDNILIGSPCGSAYRGAETNNILIGAGQTGVLGENNVIRIGGVTAATATYISGIFGSTVNAGTGTAVFVDSAGLLGTVVSSRRFKKNIQDMQEHSERIYALRPVLFEYNNQQDSVLNPGLIAEEVNEIIPELVSRDESGEVFSVKYHELGVLLLNELQKLQERVLCLEKRLEKCPGSC